MEDRFKKEIKVNDRVLFNNQDYKGRFYDYALGTIIGFTNCYVKIKPDKPEDFLDLNDNTKIYRKPENIFIIEDYKDKYLYLAAEMDNYRKNATKRANELAESGKRNVLLDILDVRDNFDLSLQNIKDESDKEGINHIIDLVDHVLNKYGVKQCDILKDDNELIAFDPNKYNAFLTQEIDDPEKDNKIAHMIKPCYMINNDIFRIGQCVVYKLKE